MRMDRMMSAVLAAASIPMFGFAEAGNPPPVAKQPKRKARRLSSSRQKAAMRSAANERFRAWMREKPDGKAALRRRRQRLTREARDALIAEGYRRNQARRMAWAARKDEAA